MGIWDRSIMRGRRILPNVEDPLTSFGDELAIEWDVPISTGLVKMAFSPRQDRIYVVGAGATIYTVAPATGVADLLIDDPYTFGEQVAVDPATGDLYGLSDYKKVRWNSDTGARISVDPNYGHQLMYFGFWVGGNLWFRGYVNECVDTDLVVQWTRPNQGIAALVAGMICLADSDGNVDVIAPETGVTEHVFSVGRNIADTGSGGTHVLTIAASLNRIALASGSGWAKRIGVYALDGTVVWERDDLATLTGKTLQNQNPMQVTADRFGDVYVLVSLRGGIILKFDGATGELVWNSDDQITELVGRFDCRHMTVSDAGDIYLTFQDGSMVKISQS